MSTEVGRKTNTSKQCIIVGYLGRIALDDDRSGGWMEWSGLVKGRAGDGDWIGSGRGDGKGRGVVTVPFYIAAT